MTVQSAYFHLGKRCTISLFCRPSGTGTAQLSPQRATGHQCQGEETEERAWMCSHIKTFWQRSGQRLCAYGLFRVKVKRSQACTLRTVNLVIFDQLAGLCLRGQHNPVSSVDAAYHGHNQRIWCEDVTQPTEVPRVRLSPSSKRSIWASWTRSSVSLIATPSRSVVCAVLILFILNKCFLQPLCCGDCFC